MEQTDRFAQIKERQKRIEENLSQINHKIAVLSGKGGVGKTTVAVNLAVALAEEGFEVGLADLDIHGPDVARMLGLMDEPVMQDGLILPLTYLTNLKVLSMAMLLEDGQPVVWRGPLKHTVIQQFLGDTNWGKLDFLIFDMPPGTGDEALSLFQLVKLDGTVIVTTPQRVAVDDVERAINFVNEMGQKVLGFVTNMAYLICPNCGTKIKPFGEGVVNELMQRTGVNCLGEVPMDPVVAQYSDVGKPVVSFLRGSEAEKSFRKIVGNILREVGE
ncbi:Mrp/NBP35 family ATP-binding protein [Pseudothermotoga sp. U03pept]|uniref:Mrp/NBP35 family ATP-binding protein n=1 Tax=Pseudothermotoga sp. U03pept TaxID=3447012 RepID=UPI003F014FDD